MSNSGRTAYYIVFRESDVPNACKDLVAPRVVGITAGGKWGGVCAALRILGARTFKAGIYPIALQSKHIVSGFVKLIVDHATRARSLVPRDDPARPISQPYANGWLNIESDGTRATASLSRVGLLTAQRCAGLWVSTAVEPLRALEETG